MTARATLATDDQLVGRLVESLTAHPTADEDHVFEWIREAYPLACSATVAGVVQRVMGRTSGLGLIEELLDDPMVTEVMINGPGPVWVDRGDRPERADLVLDANDIGLLIERILDPLGLRVDRSSPLVDARLSDGSRVNVIVPPLAVDGPVVTIRRFSARPIPLAEFGPEEAIITLTDLMRARSTMLVVGGTAAGKTTLLNALGTLFDPAERVITIEDTAELQLPGAHTVRLEARPANSEGIGEVTMRELVRNALRMRPDRLVIGEVRGAEALDLVLALNTGHRASLATCHASGAIGALRRLETLAMLGDAGLPVAAIRDQVRSAFDAVVAVDRIGSRRRITTIAKLDLDSGEPVTLWEQR